MYEWSLDPYHSWTDINNTHNRTSNIGNNAREKIAIAYIQKNIWALAHLCYNQMQQEL